MEIEIPAWLTEALFCRIFQRRMEENRRHFENETDRKLLRKIEEKKAAHGLKQG